MAESSFLDFGPVLHNITGDRVIFCYRAGDGESLEVAEHYCNNRDVPSSHMVPLPCTTDLYVSEQQYIDEIETPILNKLNELGEDLSSSGQREIWVIILGFNVPIAFYSGFESEYVDPYNDSNLIAIASRLHRIGRNREDQFPNPTYDRRQFKFFDSDDSDSVYITSVINAPTKELAKKLIDRALIVDNMSFVTGKIMLDPYGKRSTEAQINYENDILDFINNGFANLGLDSEQTSRTFNGTDPFISKMQDDAFYFGWFTPRYSKSLFANQNVKRVFLYNADSDSAANILEPLSNSSDPWCNLAINVEPGYASCAGAISDPEERCYLRPRPFFNALHHGACLGEAFLFSSPVVDWKIILIGDPLMVVNFPNEIPAEEDLRNTEIPNHECIRLIKESLEETIAYGRRQSRLLSTVFNNVLNSTEVSEAVNLLHPIKEWSSLKNDSNHNSLLNRAVTDFLHYIAKTENMTFEQWLSSRNEKTTIYFNEVLGTTGQGVVDSEYLYETGTWRYDFKYNHVRNVLENVHFRLQVSLTSNFNDVLIDEDSSVYIDGWKREIEPYTFVSMISSGLPSNFSGRRIRFESTSIADVLTPTEEYFIRWRPLDRHGIAIADWTEDSKKMIVKR